MTKKLRSTSVLPADTDTAFALRTSAEWVEQKAGRLLDGSRVQERRAGDGREVELVLSRDIPGEVPSVFRRFLPADGRVTQRESWTAEGDGSYRVTWLLGFDGAPGSVSGEGQLVADGEGSALRLHGVAQVSVPVIGGKAEAFLVPLVERVMQQEGKLLASLLAVPT